MPRLCHPPKDQRRPLPPALVNITTSGTGLRRSRVAAQSRPHTSHVPIGYGSGSNFRLTNLNARMRK